MGAKSMVEGQVQRSTRRGFLTAGGIAVGAVGASLFSGPETAAAADTYATLGPDGKVTIDQLPDRVLTRFGGRPVGENALVFNVNDYVDSLSPTLDKAERDTQAWENALSDAAAAQGGQANRFAVVVGPGGDFYIKRTLTWNTRVSIDGHCEMTSQVPPDASGNSQYMWILQCDDQGIGYWETRQHATTFSNVICAGDESLSTKSHGILLEHIDPAGSSDVKRAAYLTFRNTTWRAFDTAITFGQHAYMISFHSSSIQGNVIGARAKAPTASQVSTWDSGERFVFEDCDLTSNFNLGFSIDYDQAMHFAHCSFDLIANGDASAGSVARGQAYLTNCHLEMWAPNSTPASVTPKAGLPWFDLTDFGASLQLTDCRMLIRARPGVTGDADCGIIRFSSASPSKGQRAVIRGGTINGSATSLRYLATGTGGRLTVNETQTIAGTVLTPHSNQSDPLLRDGIAGLTVIFDDWIVLPAGVDTIVPTAFPGFGSGVDGRAFKMLHKTKGTTSNVYLYIPIQTAARALINFDWAVIDAVSSATAYIGYATSRKTDAMGEWEGAVVMSQAVASNKWGSVQFAQKFARTAPGWAMYLVLRFDLTQVNTGASLYVRNIKASQY
jgi:hypothetical protein